MDNKKCIIGTAICIVLMFAWIFLAVWLTDGKDPDQFNKADWTVMAVFCVLELSTLAAVFVFLHRQSKHNASQVKKRLEEERAKLQNVNKIGGYLYVGAMVVGFLSVIGGMLLRPLLTSVIDALSLPFIILMLLPVVFLGISLLMKHMSIRKLRRMDMRQMNSYVLSHREEAKETAAKKLRFVKCWLTLTDCYTVLLGLIALGIGVLGGIGLEEDFVPVVFYSAFLFLCAFSRIRFGTPMWVFEEKKSAISRQDYPRLYAMAEDAAQAVDCRLDVKIILNDDCSAGVYSQRDYCCVFLGVILLNILSEQELYAVLLHEFSHVGHKHQTDTREQAYYDWLEQGGNPHFLKNVTKLMFSGWSVVFSWQYSMYRYASAIQIESAADEAMREKGDIKAAASLLLKLQYTTLYEWEYGTYDEEPMYAPEKPDDRLLTRKIQRLQAAFAERQQDWNRLVEAEILSRQATHPTVKMRLQALGITQYEIVPPNRSAELSEELQKGLALVETLVFQARSEGYEQVRRKEYLEPLQMIEAWEEEGRPLQPERYADINTALRQLGRNLEADRLAQQAIETFTGDAASYAYFIRGCFLLHSYDPQGLVHMYRAIEENPNFIEEGLQVIGSYCCLVGDQQELDIFREKALELSQTNADLYCQTGVLDKKDKLGPENLPEGMLDKILDFIRQVDGGLLQNVYLVRKTITEDFFTSAFVLQFRDEENEENEQVYHKIFRYLDAMDWQFSLFWYVSVKQIKFEEIPGSLVYRAEEDS